MIFRYKSTCRQRPRVNKDYFYVYTDDLLLPDVIFISVIRVWFR